ncbi:unnamed protein product [Phytophthora fragariaefolia]|uniref:Unnamed protein product n=1 Tax=Phytophthora fragariaefolia TaxID=1490495 RepID=A0A9W7D703_9STRA|nr:unnamed protein product [Phytophthora fragariaefolia]
MFKFVRDPILRYATRTPLNSLGIGDAAAEVLRPGPGRHAAPFDFTVHLALQREALVLAEVYGAENLAARTVGTADYLQAIVQHLLVIEQASSPLTDSARTAKLIA